MFGHYIKGLYDSGALEPPFGQFPMTATPEEARCAFAQADYGDRCEDGNLVEVVHYLRGLRGLRIPALWRSLLPEKL